MKKVVSAGGVILRRGKILFVKLTRLGKITFPKGHVELGETFEDAALREVTEETGYKEIKIIKKLGVVTRPSVEPDGSKVIKDIHLYLMEIIGKYRTNQDEETLWLSPGESLEYMLPEEVEFLKTICHELV
jgi:diadenosine hexaphosphate hydrolase (ATP-forming)